ncbi:uncharacterized protein LOC120327973 [Styela clava]
MSSVRYLQRYLKTVFQLCILVRLSESQTTPFNEFADVSVPDQIPTIPNTANKIYTTTVNLVKASDSVTFVDSTFIAAAREFYAKTLQGFIDVENVRTSDKGNMVIQVTYDAKYAYPVLLGAVGADNKLITSAIGTFEPVRKGLNEQANIFAYYPVQNDAATFSFGGSAICAQASCVGAYVSCTEDTAGINATCVSDCKNNYCGDNGLCSHSDANKVPTCRCTTYPDLWILGQRCETKFPLWLAVLLGVIGLSIIIVVIIIVCICVKNKRKERNRKLDLLSSVPKTYHNNGFVNDEIRHPTTVEPREVVTVVPTPAIRTLSLARSDSFETVTESEVPPSEYRPRSDVDRRSYASSVPASTRNHYHHHGDRNGDRHHHHHRRHSRDRDRRRSRSRERERHRRRSRSRSSSPSENQEKEKNLSFYEIDVNDFDLETDAASSVAASSTSPSSPIKWLPPKEMQPRPGWVPSLGPLMYDLPSAKDRTTPDPPEYESVDYRRRTEGGTDV